MDKRSLTDSCNSDVALGMRIPEMLDLGFLQGVLSGMQSLRWYDDFKFFYPVKCSSPTPLSITGFRKDLLCFIR